MRSLGWFLSVFLLTAPAFAQKDAPLPPPSRTRVAKQVRASDPRIEEARQKYLAKAGQARTTKQLARDAKLKGLALEARAAYEASGDKRGRLIIIEGLDLSGKSSLAELLEENFGGMNLRIVHWGAPGPQKSALWQDDYLRELPKEGEIVIWDRSYMGRLTYDRHFDMIDDKTVDKRIDEVNGLEAMIKNQVVVTKLFYDTPGKEMARRLGKREAVDPAKLDEKGGDYVAFRDRKIIRARADYAVERTGKSIPWNVIDMKDADEGKQQALGVIIKRWSKKGASQGG
jgi:polyphosphate kinase 2 (PPK2 family)